jgi:hypothetical protein
VADHQIAHVYVRNPARVSAVKTLLEAVDGVDRVLDRAAQAAYGIDHERAGELVCVAAPERWFSYYYWLDAPADARLRPHRRHPPQARLRPGRASPRSRDRPAEGEHRRDVAQEIMGFRYYMNVIGLDARVVRGTHGRLPAHDDAGPVFLCSDPRPARDRLAMTEVRDLLLELMAK